MVPRAGSLPASAHAEPRQGANNAAPQMKLKNAIDELHSAIRLLGDGEKEENVRVV
jgi:hypothetical protein